jgi:probable rRNA maturation factor
LSFLYPGERADGLPFLGEMVIAPAVAAEQAARCKISLAAELQKLLTHGVLHLLGYDHEVDDGEMRRLESRILKTGWARRPSNPLAATERRV